MSWIEIDGSQGEGGGQILRTSVALSAITNRPLRVVNIRAKRSNPGLAHQHVACIVAAARMCGASTTGVEVKSTVIEFVPRSIIAGGSFLFEVGTAGSTMLVLQTVLPISLHATAATELRITGGTHNPMAPCADFIEHVFLPQLRSMGAVVDFSVDSLGFYPRGGGAVRCTVQPWLTRRPAQLLRRGPCLRRSVHVVATGTAIATAADAMAAFTQMCGTDHPLWGQSDVVRRTLARHDAGGPGFFIMAVLSFDHHQAMFSAVGHLKSKPADVATSLFSDVMTFDIPNCDSSSMPIVDTYLADQLLLPMVLAASGGMFTTSDESLHFVTNCEVIAAFLGEGRINCAKEEGIMSVRFAVA